MTLIKSDYNPVLKQFFSDDFFNWPAGNFAKGWKNTPAVNIKEKDEGFEIEVAAPGFKKENFEVEVENDLISISAELAADHEEKAGNYTRKEFTASGFKRSFRLPENTVDTATIRARYENGVLLITLPKKEEAKPLPAKKIEIV